MISATRVDVLVFFCFLNLPIAIKSIHNPYCSLSCEYGNEAALHTVCAREKEKCGPGPECGPNFKIIEMKNEWRQFVLDLHNKLRNKVAAGKEPRNNQPSAANMNILSYDKELEFIAQCWINTCHGNPLIHDSCRSTKTDFHIGQNLGFINSSSSRIDYKASMEELIMYWYDEVAIFKNEWIGYTDDRGPDIKVGHYTQMVWADTTRVGCAGTYYTTKNNYGKWHHFLFACNYGPGGNYISLPTYRVGTPCSQCYPVLGCNKDYNALCGKTVKINETVDEFVPLFDL